MTDTQTLTIIISAIAAMVALGLISWGFSGLFFKQNKPVATDLAAELERKNLEAKRRAQKG